MSDTACILIAILGTNVLLLSIYLVLKRIAAALEKMVKS